MTRIFSLAFSPRFIALTVVMVATAGFAGAVAATKARRPELVAGLALFGLLSALGLRDLFQTSHAVLRNYPLVGRLRFLLEEMRPEMRQYFFEDEKNGVPFDRDERAVVYQRAKRQLDTRPFGTQFDVYDRRLRMAPAFDRGARARDRSAAREDWRA